MTLHLNDLIKLRVSDLNRLGVMVPGANCSLSFGDGLEVKTTTTEDSLTFSFTANGQSHHERFCFSNSFCNYGGERTWLVCPRQGCRERSGVLYRYGGMWMCRRCTGLLYASQAETANWRANYRAWTLRIKHGIKPGETRPARTLTRPKGKHYRTHKRDIERLELVEQRAWGYSMVLAANLKARLMAKC